VGRGRGDVALGVDGFFGLAAAAGATPVGFERLWSGEGLLVFRRGSTYYFVVEVGGVWRAAWGTWDGERRQLELRGGGEEVLRAVWEGVLRVYKSLGVGRAVGEPSGGRLRLYWPDLAVFESGGAGAARAAEARVRVVGDVLVVEGGGSSWSIPFKLLRGRESLFVGGVGLWEVLAGLGVLAAREPGGVRLGREGLWGLLAAAVEAGGRPPVGVGYVGRGVVVFRVGDYVAVAARVGGVWRVAGGRVKRGVCGALALRRLGPRGH